MNNTISFDNFTKKKADELNIGKSNDIDDFDIDVVDVDAIVRESLRRSFANCGLDFEKTYEKHKGINIALLAKNDSEEYDRYMHFSKQMNEKIKKDSEIRNKLNELLG